MKNNWWEDTLTWIVLLLLSPALPAILWILILGVEFMLLENVQKRKNERHLR